MNIDPRLVDFTSFSNDFQDMALQSKKMVSEAKNEIPSPNGQAFVQTFSDLLSNAVNQVNQLQATSSDLATRFEQGDRNVTLADVMIARNKASVAFDATIQTRNKFIEAYKELMNMPV